MHRAPHPDQRAPSFSTSQCGPSIPRTCSHQPLVPGSTAHAHSRMKTHRPLSLQSGSSFLSCTHAQVPESVCFRAPGRSGARSRPPAPLSLVSDPKEQTGSGMASALRTEDLPTHGSPACPQRPPNHFSQAWEAYPITERKSSWNSTMQWTKR